MISRSIPGIVELLVTSFEGKDDKIRTNRDNGKTLSVDGEIMFTTVELASKFMQMLKDPSKGAHVGSQRQLFTLLDSQESHDSPDNTMSTSIDSKPSSVPQKTEASVPKASREDN